MPNISSQTLFHYTSNVDNIIGILSNGFKYSICLEELPNSYMEGYLDKIIHMPKIVSFCDIPITLSGEHKEYYGEYIIGLSKNWAIKKGITPVKYVHENTMDMKTNIFKKKIFWNYELEKDVGYNIYKYMAEYLKENGPFEIENNFYENIPKNLKTILEMISHDYYEFFNYFEISSSLVRQYEGKILNKKTGEIKAKIFYNEREWRAIIDGNRSDDDFLNFSLTDIEYLIVKSKEDKTKILNSFSEYSKNVNCDNLIDIENKIIIGDIIYNDL